MRTRPTGIAEPVGEDLPYPRAVRATPPDGHTSAGPVHVPGREVRPGPARRRSPQNHQRLTAAPTSGESLLSVTETAASRTHTRAEADRFRATMRNHPAGAVVITASVEGRPVGLTATSFTSVSLSPPLVSFYAADSSSTWPALRRADEFGVHLLSEGQADVAARFASKGVDRFAAPTAWQPGPSAVPLLDGAAAHLVRSRFDTRLIGDHWLVVGQVTHTLVLEDPRAPLLYHQGAFGSVAPLE